MLFEANLLENCWGGFSQTGIFDPAHADEPGWHAARSARLRMSRSVTTGSVNVARRVLGRECLFAQRRARPTADGGRYSIHDLLADSVHDQDWKGPGTICRSLASRCSDLLHDVAFDHVTAFVAGPLFYVGDRLEGGDHTEKIH